MHVLTTAPYPLPPGLLEGRSHRAASVVCTEDVEVMVMDREVFNRVVMDDDKGGGKNKCANERHLERHRDLPHSIALLHASAHHGARSLPHRLADSMREKAEARQRARLLKVFEMMSVTMQQRRTLSKGSVVFREGEAASHFYIVVRALRSRG
jgi:CRP-like cAMP-binding protein